MNVSSHRLSARGARDAVAVAAIVVVVVVVVDVE